LRNTWRGGVCQTKNDSSDRSSESYFYFQIMHSQEKCPHKKRGTRLKQYRTGENTSSTAKQKPPQNRKANSLLRR